MTIRLKNVCPEQLGPLPDGEYTVADACSAAAALRACMEIAGLPPLSAETERVLLFMRNGRHIKPDEPIAGGDRLTVLRPLTGG